MNYIKVAREAGLVICLCMGLASAGELAIQPRMGEPIQGLTPEQLARFEAGKVQYDRIFTVEEGLGPIFNHISCSACHDTPRGGVGTVLVTRAGRVGENGFDPLAELGGSLFQDDAISDQCAEVVPAEATIVAHRITNGMLGFGLVESITDQAIQALADNPPPGISGTVHWVEVAEDPPNAPPRAGRFGWKAQKATILSFSADAALNEIGLTSAFFPEENDPNGANAPPTLGDCDTVADPEVGVEVEGFDFLERVTDFQRFLAPPSQTPKSGLSGEVLFHSIGCTACHVPSFTTPNSEDLEEALRNVEVRPYSDFLLHDMGEAADFIGQGAAGMTELRTPPLMGLRVRPKLWHDGRFDDASFAVRATAAIEAHGAAGSEGMGPASAWGVLSADDQALIIAFLDTLGRAEFDADGNNDIDVLDHAALLACRTAPQAGAYTPDSACSICDIDQDGDVDLGDFSAFQRAFTGS